VLGRPSDDVNTEEGLLGDKLVIFTDAQAALSRLRNHDEGPGQQIARWAFKSETALCREGVSIEYRWVPLACRLSPVYQPRPLRACDLHPGGVDVLGPHQLPCGRDPVPDHQGVDPGQAEA
jgi:hypothetical protein